MAPGSTPHAPGGDGPTGDSPPTPPGSNDTATGSREAWQAAFDASPGADVPHATMSGVPVDGVYGHPPYPGQFPYTRGIHASMYRTRNWTMRMFAGFGTAGDTNARFHELLAAGGTGLSTAFDMPTLLGRDSDHEWSIGEVGRAGVAVDSLADMEDLFAGIDLSQVTTSMTINGPAAPIMAAYVAVAEGNGTPRARLGGTIQNDILKEYHAQKEYLFPPRPSMRLVTDLMAFAAAEIPKWNPVSVSGYHIREAGSTAAQELAFTLADGFAYVEAAIAAGLDVDTFAPRLSFFFNSHSDFFEEIGKFRAARRIWATWMRHRYGATDERSMKLRFHTQTAGVSLTAQQSEINIARVATQALAAVLGGTQSLHTDSHDEALALPTEQAARIALRTQQIIAEETGVTAVADPLGGSEYVEWMTDEMERQAGEIFDHLDKLGSGSMLEGVYEGIEAGYFMREISEASYTFERAVNTGDRITVGVNGYTDGDDGSPRLLSINPEVEALQLKRLENVRRSRNNDSVNEALSCLATSAADSTINLMPPLIEAMRAHVTLGETTACLEGVFGSYREAEVL
ncbi:acyl-CoA mutase large subunit family protein [Candidatus Microthrix parvicella]|uniref:acyl-CoA mutase large subunit family protein n=2 Tax=Candidatus Neomicrothrix TaxID=41949 RepID=UPI000368A0AB|nr:methylmalonyl-CoA mutase family protein [Candidatus Microthrix parvicella]